MAISVTESARTVLADLIVMKTMSYLPSITGESLASPSDDALRIALTNAIASKSLSRKSRAGNHFLNLVTSLEHLITERMSAEEILQAMPRFSQEDPSIPHDINQIAQSLASLVKTSFEGLKALNMTAESIIEAVDNESRDLSYSFDDGSDREIDFIDLGVADDPDILAEAVHYVENYIPINDRSKISELNPERFRSIGMRHPYPELDITLKDAFHETCDRCSIHCPREDLERLFFSPTLKGTLFSPMAVTNKDAFLSGSLFIRDLWNTLSSIIGEEGSDDVHDGITQHARRLLELTSVAAFYYASLLANSYKNVLIFGYSDRLIFVSPLAYAKADEGFDMEDRTLDSTIKLFIALKALKGITAPEHGWSISEIVHKPELIIQEKDRIETESLKSIHEKRASLQRTLLDAQLRAALHDISTESLTPKARSAFRNALKNGTDTPNHVLDYLVYGFNHPVVTAFHEAAKTVTRSNEDFTESKTQGTFDAVGSILIKSLSV